MKGYGLDIVSTFSGLRRIKIFVNLHHRYCMAYQRRIIFHLILLLYGLCIGFLGRWKFEGIKRSAPCSLYWSDVFGKKHFSFFFYFPGLCQIDDKVKSSIRVIFFFTLATSRCIYSAVLNDALRDNVDTFIYIRKWSRFVNLNWKKKAIVLEENRL